LEDYDTISEFQADGKWMAMICILCTWIDWCIYIYM